MKFKLFFSIILFALACSFVSGQAANQVFNSDTIHGDEDVYFTGTKESGIYQGVAGFVFTTSHDDADFYLQGCYKTCDTCWYNIDTTEVTGASAVNNIMYQTPPLYKYYRLYGDGSAGDTCIINNCRYFLKY